MSSEISIPVITTDENHISIFSKTSFPQSPKGGMVLTDRIDARNFRMRESSPGYISNWHVAGDATFIIIQQGILRIELRDSTYRDFKPGDAFIALDDLPEGTAFDDSKHGHRARVIGSTSLRATHIKLSAAFREPLS